MDFGKKIVANLRADFREAKSETRREKARAKASLFRAKRKSAKRKLAAKIFSSFCENHPIFGVANSAY